MPSIFPSASPTQDMVNAPETLTRSPPPSTTASRSLGSVFQSSSIGPAVDIPFSVINRPLPSVLDDAKVQQFIKDIQVSLVILPELADAALKLSFPRQKGDELTPLEVFRVALPDGRRYFIAFGGCHRWVLATLKLALSRPRGPICQVHRSSLDFFCRRYEAYKQLGSPTVRGVIINVPPSMIRQHLGASCPF
jgi:sulfiredoxin